MESRQIWELIQGEMEYVADLRSMETLFVNGLRFNDDELPIPARRVEVFLDDAFHNYRSLLDVHSHLLEALQARQLEQHPHFGMVSDLVLDAALNWQDAYMEYVMHYPIAKAKVKEEEKQNEGFSKFLAASQFWRRSCERADWPLEMSQRPLVESAGHLPLHQSPHSSSPAIQSPPRRHPQESPGGGSRHPSGH